MKIAEKELKIMYTADEVQERIKTLAAELNDFYNGEELVVICVLKGAVMFFTDLVKHFNMPMKMLFIRLSSYGIGFESTGEVKAIDLDLPDIDGKNVLIVEDVIDTGHTAKFLMDYIKKNHNTKSAKFCALLNKKGKRVADVDADFSGFIIEDKFLVGYGLDFEGYYRNIPYVGYVDV